MGAEMGPGADVEHHHHHHTGHRWLDITLGVAAVFISLMSVLLALQHGRAMEKMVEVSSWPYVRIDTSNGLADGTPRIRLTLANKGVGPAKIETIEVFYRGVAQPDPVHLLGAMLNTNDRAKTPRAFLSDVLGSVLSARDEANLFDISRESMTDEQYQRLSAETANLEFRICYCSVFDECSLRDSRSSRMPEPVKACPVPKIMFLH